MVYKHIRVLPEAYSIEYRADGFINIWLCRQIDTYIDADGHREYDIDVRVVCGVESTPGLEEDIRLRFEAWWDMAIEN